MGTRARPSRPFRPALILMAVLCVAAATPLVAQQTADTTRAAATVTAPASAPHATTAPAPQAAERFGRVGVGEARQHVRESAAFAAQGGSHTIVISTLALVLIVIIVVLLVR